MPSCDRDGRDVFLIVVAAQFDIPPPGEADGTLQVSAVQTPPPLADEHVGEPGRSSVRMEGQSAYTKPATDVSLWGAACARDGQPTPEMMVGIRVGPCVQLMHVHGDRVWERSLRGGVRPSAPVPFVRVPLVWERAFGGVGSRSTDEQPLFEPRNPVGCGLESDDESAVDRPVPNIEDPRQLLTNVSNRPRPVGVTPVARHWTPRIAFAGTYDEAWRRERAPLWPLNFDERFFCAAPVELQARPHLRGGEPVVLDGLHPAGRISFRLPTLPFVARSRFVDRTARTALTLDGVHIDTEALRLTMYFRSFVRASLSLIKHRETLLRLLEPWEKARAQ